MGVMQIDHIASIAGHIAELAGIVVLVAGGALACVAFVVRLMRGMSFGASYHELRADLGRAILLGEQITPSGARVDIQLKGPGPTQYSRRGDGRAR